MRRVNLNNRLISIGIVSLLITAGFLGFITFEPKIVCAGGGIIYVDDDNAGYEDGSLDHPYNTIQEGVNASFPGDTVFVFNGTYYENLWINKVLNLTGEDRDITIIDGGGSNNTVLVISSWVNITGFTVTGSGGTPHRGGINLGHNKNCKIINNNITNCSDAGIYLYESSDNLIVDNNIFSNHRGIRLWAAMPSHSHYVSNNIIANNTIFSNDQGIDHHFSSNNTVTGNNLSNNGNGFHLDLANYNIITNNILSKSGVGIGLGGSNYNLITDNTIASVEWDGIILLEGGRYPSNNNTIANNSISSCNRYGIAIVASSYNEIRNNTIYNCSSWRLGDNSAILLESYASSDSSYNIISNNNISSNYDHGIHIPLWASAFNNEINNNTISHNLKYGVYFEVVQSNNITNNNIWDNLEGIFLRFSYKNKIAGNNVYLNKRKGITIFRSNSTNVSCNNVFLNENDGINLSNSTDNNIIGNIVLNNSDGISISDSSNNTVTNNMVNSNKVFGIHLSTSWNNSIYHNYLINNSVQAYDNTNNGNQWDNGYPSGGNYWSDFDEPSEGAFDDFKGQDQNASGSDGIVDLGLPLGGKNPYVIDADSRDNYPFIDYIGEQVLRPLQPTLYINISSDERDVVLFWDPPSSSNIEYYLIYRSESQTAFNFSTIWVNTSSDMEPGEAASMPLRTMWNDTNAAFPGNETNYKEQYYYIIRAVNDVREVSRTSRTVGKWTKIFPHDISTFSLPLEPLKTLTADYLLTDMNADYIKYMNSTTHVWEQHNLGDGNINDTQMKLGESYEVKFNNPTTYTFTGMPAAMIMYDDDSGVLGFDHVNEAKNLAVSIEANKDVHLTWQEPACMDPGDWYEVYYSNMRDGFLGTFGKDYFLVCPPVNYGTNTATHMNAQANDPGARLYYMVVPFNVDGVRGSSTYSIGIWTEEYLSGYDTFGIPLKLSTNQTVDWYCENIPDTVGINYFNVSTQQWRWHSTRMPKGAYDPVLVMIKGYQISASGTTKFTFVGV